MEEPNDYSNYDENYKNSISNDIENGSFFKDGWDYYTVRYLSAISDRTFYIFMAIVGVVITISLIKISTYIFPLKEEIYITIKENDLTKYQTNIVDLAKYKNTQSSDESLLRYLVENYVKERESHNYQTANINDFNLKLSKIQNTSSTDVYREFRNFMSRTNKNGPYYFFGKNITTEVKILNSNFIRIKRERLIDNIIDFFSIKIQLPIKLEVFYELITNIGEKKTISRRKAVISFRYSPIEYDYEKNVYKPVKVIITQYKNYLLK